jgi:hypothetical protein
MRYRQTTEFSGWAVPMVGQSKYHFTFNSTTDWRTLRLMYSEPSYLAPSEWLYLSTNFTDYRLLYRVVYSTSSSVSEVRPWQLDRLPVPTDQMGTGAMGLADATKAAPNNTWHVILNSVNATSTSASFKHRIDVSTAQFVAAQLASCHVRLCGVVQVDAFQCPLEGCPPPPPPIVVSCRAVDVSLLSRHPLTCAPKHQARIPAVPATRRFTRPCAVTSAEGRRLCAVVCWHHVAWRRRSRRGRCCHYRVGHGGAA